MESDSIFLPETSEGLTPQPHRPPSPAASRVKLLILVLVLTSCTSVQTPEAECGDPNWYLQVWRIGVPETQLDEPEAFILPQTSHGPLHCTTPADIYLLLKSSDFIDLDPGTAYQGCDDEDKEVRLELVLKRSVEINPAREMRCSVRENVLLGVSQRDTNLYEHLQSEETRMTICDTIRAFYEDEVRGVYDGGNDYIFDHKRVGTPSIQAELLRHLRPQTSRNAPVYASSMMPIEMVEMSLGRSLGEFREEWEGALAAGLAK